MNLLQPMTIAGLLVGGLGVALLGSVKVPLARRLHIDEARVGGLVSMFGFTMIPVILTAGFLTDLVGKQVVLAGGSVLMAGSLVVLARCRGYWSALIGVLMLSAAWSALVNVLNVLTPFAFPGNLASAVNLANVYFGLGAFLTPLAVVLLLRWIRFTPALLVLAILVLVPPMLAVGVDFSALAPGADQEAAPATADLGMAAVLVHPVVWLCALAMFFYTPVEAATAAWTTTYLGDKGVTERAASGLLSAFWLTFMTARLVTAFCLPPGSEMALIIGLSLACVLVLTGVVLSRSRAMAVAMVIAAGFVFGPIFPTLMAVLLGHTEPSLHGRVVGLFFAVGGVGWTTIPMLIGAYARRTSVQRGFLVAVASAVGLCAVVMMLAVKVSG